MGRILTDIIDDWVQGVITSIEADALPPNASPRGFNSALTSVGGGKAVVMKRRGMSVMNATAVTGTPVILGQPVFKRRSGATLTQHHLLVSNGGRLDSLGTDGVLTTIDATGFTSGTYFPDFAIQNNLLFIVNGQEAKKFDGTDLTTMGITRPTVGSMAGAAGAAGSHNGTYELRVTYGNSGTGQESSASNTASATVTVTNEKIDWTAIPTSADTQVDRRYLYVRNTATQANFYRADTITDNTATTATTNIADTALATKAPSTTENDPPITGVTQIESHRSRMFATDGVHLYYSKPGLPEAFNTTDDFERVNPDDGQRLVALHSAHEILILFKNNAMYGLYGDDPQSWVVQLIDPDVGCTSHRSIKTVEGKTYWWSEQGPMVWDGASPPIPIGQERISVTVGPDNVNFNQLSLICAGVDFPRQHLLFSVPGAGQTRNTILLPYNYRVGAWDANRWDPMDIASFGEAEDANGQPWLFPGNYAGQGFKWWNADNDGVASGTTSGTFVASGTSVTTVTDAGATFDTTGGGLVERKVTIVDSTGLQVGSVRPYISSNTATAFTMATAVSGLTDAATYTYYVGGPDFQWDSGWRNFDLPWDKKRFEYLYAQAKSTGSATTVYVDLAFNYDTSTGQSKALTFTTTAPSAEWDVALWDSSAYGTQAAVSQRLRVGRTGRVYRARFRNAVPDQSVTILRMGTRAEQLTDKS